MRGMEKVKGMGMEKTGLVSATWELWGDKIYVGKKITNLRESNLSSKCQVGRKGCGRGHAYGIDENE